MFYRRISRKDYLFSRLFKRSRVDQETVTGLRFPIYKSTAWEKFVIYYK